MGIFEWIVIPIGIGVWILGNIVKYQQEQARIQAQRKAAAPTEIRPLEESASEPRPEPVRAAQPSGEVDRFLEEVRRRKKQQQQQTKQEAPRRQPAPEMRQERSSKPREQRQDVIREQRVDQPREQRMEEARAQQRLEAAQEATPKKPKPAATLQGQIVDTVERPAGGFTIPTVSAKKRMSAAGEALMGMLQDRQVMRAAFLLNEVLGKPKSMRR